MAAIYFESYERAKQLLKRALQKRTKGEKDMKSKKFVFYVSSLSKGGAQRVILNLTESLLKKGHHVVIVTTMVCQPEYDLPEGARRIFSDITEEETTTNRVINFIRRFRKLRNIWKNERPDVLVSFIGKNNFMAILTAWGLKIPVVTSVRGEPNAEYYDKMQQVLAKTLMGKADGLILQTPDAKAYFPKWIQKKAVILENPLNPLFIDDYYEGTRKNEIVTVGRLDGNKNQKLIIDAFCQIAGDFPEVNLILYGSGEDHEKLIEYAQKTPYKSQIFLPGPIRNVKTRIEKSKIFVLSSNTEGMPNSLMEALALGIPSISTDCPCGGPRMLMKGKENGILVPVGKAEPMAKAMRTLLTDEELWEKYSRNAYKLCEELHPERVNGKWEEYLLSKMRR